MLPEQIKSGLKTHYQTHYAAFLAEVEASHAGDPITLEDFKEIIFSNPRLFQVGRQYPYADIADTVSRAESEAQQSPVAGPWGTTIEIRKRFQGNDLEVLAKIINRHQEAFLLMASDDEVEFPFRISDLEFRTMESNEPFFQGLLIRFRVRHRV